MARQTGFGASGGIIAKFFTHPSYAIVAIVFLFVGAQFLDNALNPGGVLDIFMNSIEGIVNKTGFTSASSIFDTGGGAFLIIGALVIGGAIAFLASGTRR